MKKISTILLIFMVLVSCNPIKLSEKNPSPLQVLIITGGHDFDPAFFELFKDDDELRFDTISQPRANELLCSDSVEQYHVFVFYDMVQEITPFQKDCFLKLLEIGKGMVFLHHSLVSYQQWPEYSKIVGGRYILETGDSLVPASGYMHDLDLLVRATDPEHPLTSGITEFQLHDEGYFNIHTEDRISPILTTMHPYCNSIIGWFNFYLSSRIVYLLPGHDRTAWENPDVQKLYRNAILWTGKRTGD